ncbi:hypothetical protein FB45DRAFT_1042457 [Roridomyces roridus]|uniref:Uncharacterized protein n=1 Tax=Roridomyces roridus TaxID=1738132 RepID=A0AAD7F6M6_9AGAR|nr:hypothetical protein FB45DRAFT_1042457 [Roridomyces roridus]
MAAGRPPLEPDERQRRRQQSRQDYEDRNRDTRLSKARERMQRKRAAVSRNPKAHLKAKRKAAEQSEGYRDRKLLQERADARAAKDELNIRKYVFPSFTFFPTSASNPPSLLSNVRKSEIFTKHLPARTARAAPLSKLPQPLDGPARAGRSLTDIAASDSEEDDCSSAFLSRPSHPVRCTHCYGEECVGCACLCDASDVWIEHEGGHFFPRCERCGFDDCPGRSLRWHATSTLYTHTIALHSMPEDAHIIQIQAEPRHFRRHREATASKPSPPDEVPGWDADVIHMLAPSRTGTVKAAERSSQIRARAQAAAQARRTADDKLVKLLKAGPEGRAKRRLAREIRKDGKRAGSTSSKAARV